MQIELYLNGEKKIFTTPIVPMLAKRKWLEMQNDESVDFTNLSPEQFDDLATIIQDVVFEKQFTLDQLYRGASESYLNQKIVEAIHGIKPDDFSEEDDPGNVTGEER
ncbi:phage tail assembly chaperone G [Halobacillus salinus]|uniref:phage tail assembly chaperone G n=1 Tax=Halobacillus salinus TaxID=192814 RepID=UPI0009A708B1|nr:hypothetical protein [Halobacillus salinus]